MTAGCASCHEDMADSASLTSGFDINTWLTGEQNDVALDPQESLDSSNLLGSENDVRSRGSVLSLGCFLCLILN